MISLFHHSEPIIIPLLPNTTIPLSLLEGSILLVTPLPPLANPYSHYWQMKEMQPPGVFYFLAFLCVESVWDVIFYTVCTRYFYVFVHIYVVGLGFVIIRHFLFFLRFDTPCAPCRMTMHSNYYYCLICLRFVTRQCAVWMSFFNVHYYGRPGGLGDDDEDC